MRGRISSPSSQFRMRCRNRASRNWLEGVMAMRNQLARLIPDLDEEWAEEEGSDLKPPACYSRKGRR